MIANDNSAQCHDQDDTTRWRDALAGASLNYRNLSLYSRLKRREVR